MTDEYRAGQWPTWEALEKHVASGELRESHILEFKRDDYIGGESKKKDQAKDIAALAIDGGVLLIGVEEDKSSGAALSLTPVELAGVVERIDQGCASRITPPLRVIIRDDLRSPQDPAKGVVIIEVPATGIPHMVDHRYYGRDNRTTRALDHTEVVRLLARRDLDQEVVERELDAAYALMGEQGMSDARMVITATPIPLLRKDALRDQLAGNASAWFNARMAESAARVDRERTASEALSRLTRPWQWMNHVDGWGTSQVPGGVAQRFRRGEKMPFTIEVLESGAVRLAADFVTEEHEDNHSNLTAKVVYLEYAISFTCTALAWIASVAEEAGLRGTYGIGVHMAGLRDAIREPTTSAERIRLHVPDKPRYRDDTYRQVLLVTGADLDGPLPPLIDQLFGMLLRSLGYGDPLRHAGS